MPLNNLTAVEAARNPTVIYNAPDGSGRTYGATVVKFAARPATPPQATSAVEVDGQGTLGAITASYRYTVVVDGVESLPATARATSAPMVGTDNAVDLTMPAVATAQFYRIYTSVARTAGTELLLATVPATGSPVVYRDTGALTPAGALPAGALPTGAATLRIHTVPGSDSTVSPRQLAVVEPATTVGQAGRYEYHRI